MDFIAIETWVYSVYIGHPPHSSMGTSTLTHTQQSQVAHTVTYYKIGKTSQIVQHRQQYGFNNSKQQHAPKNIMSLKTLLG